jgi:hypothetical protein
MPSKIDIEQRSISERDVEGAKKTTFQSTVVFELDMKGRYRLKIVEIVFAEGPQLKLSNENQADEAKHHSRQTSLAVAWPPPYNEEVCPAF